MLVLPLLAALLSEGGDLGDPRDGARNVQGAGGFGDAGEVVVGAVAGA